MGPQISMSPLDLNMNRISSGLELGTKLDQNWLQVAGTIRLEAGGQMTSTAPLVEADSISPSACLIDSSEGLGFKVLSGQVSSGYKQVQRAGWQISTTSPNLKRNRRGQGRLVLCDWRQVDRRLPQLL